MKVAVLGCSGKMGSFFVRHFTEAGDSVTGSDRRPPARSRPALRFRRSNSQAVRDADITVVAVPMDETEKVVREVKQSLRKGSVLIEISSVKGKRPSKLKRVLGANGVSLLSIHPLFGPKAGSSRLKICVIGDKRGLATARSLFPEATLIQLSARDHDRLMAYALSLVHLVNLVFVSTLIRGVGASKFGRVAPPTAATQLNLSKAVLSQDPSLITRIQFDNPFVSEVLSSLIEEIQEIGKAIRRGDSARFERKFAALAEEFAKEDLDKSLGSLYRTAAE